MLGSMAGSIPADSFCSSPQQVNPTGEKMRKYMINVAKKDESNNILGIKYRHLFLVEMGGNDKNDIREVAKEIMDRFPSPEFKVEVFESEMQYYTQVSV